ncbi:MAG: hypothetical protein Q8P10_03755, partial [bacterium]|nr:hypothetical protein [bacterium]
MKDFLLLAKNRLKLICQKLQSKQKNNKKDSGFNYWNLYFLLPIFLLLMLLALFFYQINLRSAAESEKLFYLPFSVKVNPYPRLTFSFNQKEAENLISAKSAIVMDNDSKIVLFAKNPNLPLPMASTTKIMTAITGLNYFKLNDVLIVKDDSINGAVLGFKKGEQLTFESLLYAMLLPSANDAAKAISENYEGGEAMFINKMNGNALNFKLENTHFTDSIGLDQKNYTTSHDLARL